MLILLCLMGSESATLQPTVLAHAAWGIESLLDHSVQDAVAQGQSLLMFPLPYSRTHEHCGCSVLHLI